MRKILITMMILMSVLILGSCFDDNNKTKITIGFWPDSSLKTDVDMYNVWKERFEKDYPEYEIVPQPFMYSLDAFNSASRNNTLPTVYQTWFTEPEMIINQGSAADITDIVNELGWLTKMDPELKSYLMKDNRLYGIPRDGYGLGLVINLTVFEDAGLASDIDGDGIIDIVDPSDPSLKFYPETMQELYDFSVQIKEYTGNLGLIIQNADKNGGWQFSNFAWNFGAELQTIDEDGVVHANLNDPKSVEAMEFLKSFYHDEVYEELSPVGTITYSKWATDLGSGVVGMAICGNDAINQAITVGGMKKENIAFVPMPEGPYGDRFSLFGGTPYMFSGTDEEVEGAVRFLEYCGRSPEVSSVSVDAMNEGMLSAVKQNMFILPEIKPWINEEFVQQVESLNEQYIFSSLSNYHNFRDFYDLLPSMRRPEEKYLAQQMYELLDQVVFDLKVFSTNVLSQLNSVNSSFEELLRRYFSN